MRIEVDLVQYFLSFLSLLTFTGHDKFLHLPRKMLKTLKLILYNMYGILRIFHIVGSLTFSKHTPTRPLDVSTKT